MDPLVESALISAAATLVGVGGTAAVAIAGFRFSRRTLDDTRDGQIADRYTKAIEQLGSKELDVRIGGIYALERIARDSERDQPAIIEVLTAFIREHNYERAPQDGRTAGDLSRATRPDVQAAVTVVARRDTGRDIRSIDIRGARLPVADLTGAKFDAARLVDANLRDANLTGAHLHGADFTGADLSSAKLEDAKLEGAKWPADAPVPDGWKLGASSGRLERSGADSRAAEAS